MKPGRTLRIAVRPLLELTILAICFGAFTLRMNAQVATTTEISGTVTDPSGAVIAGARVTLINQGTGAKLETASNPSGEYAFLNIRPGTYTVLVSFQGFENARVTERTVDIGSPAHVDVVMRVGSAAQTVTVSAKGAELINTTTAEISGTMNEKLVANLPVINRDFLALAEFTPGAAPQLGYGSFGQTGYAQESQMASSLVRVAVGNTSIQSGTFIGGNRDSAANVSIDGSNVQTSWFQGTTQLQSTADIQEVKVESGIMNAEFGDGAAAINVTTKSGTNDFHGEAYDFLRNKDLDANNFFNNLAGQSLPPYRLNQFGGAVGGPIIRNKLHFFANYEGERAWQGVVSESITPPASLRAGNFNNIGQYNSSGNPVPGGPVYNPWQVDPTTGQRQPFANNTIPAGATNVCSPEPTCIDPVSAAFLAYTPLPTTIIDNFPDYISTNSSQIQQDQGTARIDWDKSLNSRIYGRFTDFKSYSISTGALPLAGVTNPYSSENVAASWIRSLGPSSVNELWVSYTRPTWYSSRDTSVSDISSKIGMQNTSAFGGAPTVSVAGFGLANGYYQYSGSIENSYQFKDDYGTIRGRHSLKFGFEANQRRWDYIGQQYDKGSLGFINLYSQACPLGNAACTTALAAQGLTEGGNGMGDYLLGTEHTERLTISGSNTHDNMSYYAGFAQDSWRVRPKLTLNYGLRYEYWSPWQDTRNNVLGYNKYTGTLTYVLQNPLDFFSAATDYGKNAPLTPGVSRTLYTTGDKDFAPRLGLAYLLTPNTTIRAGTGIFFDGSVNANQMASDQGVSIGPFGNQINNTSAGSETVPPYLFRNNFPAPPTTSQQQSSLSNPPSFQIMDTSSPYKTPTIYEWSFSLQRKLGSAWGLEMTYFGTHTIREMQYEDYNPANLPVGALASLSVNQRRLFPQWGPVSGWADIGWAKYNALTVTMRNTSWHGLTVLSTFTYAKDTVTSPLGTSDQGMPDYRTSSAWAGASLRNPALRYVTTWTYALPVGKGLKFNTRGPVDWVAGGWNVSGVAEFQQGGHQWFEEKDNSSTALVTGFDMPNVVCNPNNVPGGRTRFNWFNTNCYQPAAFGTFGNGTLGSFIEPGINNWDLSVAKSFRLPVPKLEASQLYFRADFYNAFNHTQWLGADFNYSNTPNPGYIPATQPARQMQLSLTYNF